MGPGTRREGREVRPWRASTSGPTGGTEPGGGSTRAARKRPVSSPGRRTPNGFWTAYAGTSCTGCRSTRPAGEHCSAPTPSRGGPARSTGRRRPRRWRLTCGCTRTQRSATDPSARSAGARSRRGSRPEPKTLRRGPSKSCTGGCRASSRPPSATASSLPPPASASRCPSDSTSRSSRSAPAKWTGSSPPRPLAIAC